MLARAFEEQGWPQRSVYLFTLEGGPDEADVYTRMFAPELGIAEDPATGSASGPLGGYLVRHSLPPRGGPADPQSPGREDGPAELDPHLPVSRMPTRSQPCASAAGPSSSARVQLTAYDRTPPLRPPARPSTPSTRSSPAISPIRSACSAPIGTRRGKALVVRVFQPAAHDVTLRVLHPVVEDIADAPDASGGVFEAVVPGATSPAELDYRVVTQFASGVTVERGDPYNFGRVLTDFDMHLFGEGRHLRTYQKLGAHVMTLGHTRGVHFAVWAPSAQRVSVIGDFNGWDGRVHVMRNLLPGGVWEIFLPDLDAGERYKFEIRTRAGHLLEKSDPYAFYSELPPRTASVVHDASGYEWQDAAWIDERRTAHSWFDRPMSVYEVHLGSWRRNGAARTGELPQLPGARGPARALRQGDGLHAHRAAAGDGAPVPRIVGLPGDRRSTRRRAGSARPRTSSSSSMRVTRRASACCSTGCPGTSRRTRTAWRISTARRSSSTRTRARASTRTGAR